MKIVFARTEDHSLQLVSLCHVDEEVALNHDFWREKYGPDAIFYVLDSPGWELSAADVADGGEAATQKATDLIINTLQRVSAGEHVAELHQLDRVPDPSTPAAASQTVAEAPVEADIVPVRYVIWHADAGEFWAGTERGPAGDTSQPRWTASPATATSFAQRDEAETTAHTLVAAHRRRLAVCALHETASHYWHEPLREFFPMDPSPSLN